MEPFTARRERSGRVSSHGSIRWYLDHENYKSWLPPNEIKRRQCNRWRMCDYTVPLRDGTGGVLSTLGAAGLSCRTDLQRVFAAGHSGSHTFTNAKKDRPCPKSVPRAQKRSFRSCSRGCERTRTSLNCAAVTGSARGATNERIYRRWH